MVIHNQSKRPTKTIKRLVRFVEQHCASFDLITAYIMPADANQLIAGWACKFDLGTYLQTGAPSYVQLDVATDYKYPQSSCYRKSVGEVEFRNWEEEFLFVLAHETRHIDQFWVGRPKHPEVDAELHAVHVLKEWRDSV